MILKRQAAALSRGCRQLLELRFEDSQSEVFRLHGIELFHFVQHSRDDLDLPDGSAD